MIISDYEHHNGLKMEGSMKDVTAECILIMREIYRKNRETFNQEIALGILTNMVIKAIDEKAEANKIDWQVSEDEKLDYTE